MVLYITAAFVVLCSIIVITGAMYVIWWESRDEQDPVRPDWLYGEQGQLQAVGKPSVRMDIPQKYPLLRTRNSKVLR